MFATKLSRAAHRGSVLCSCPGSHTSTAPQCLATITTRSPHQRRPSSSKASCPPDSATGRKPAPAAKAEEPSAESGDASSSVPAKTPVQKSLSSKGRSRGTGFKRLHAHHASKLAGEPVDQFAGLPSVPNLRNLTSSDISLSAFFSQHRPLSLASPLPPPSSTEAFNNIFAPREQEGWANGNSAERRPEDIIITLQHTIDSLEGSQHQEESDGIRWEIVSMGDVDVKHLDGTHRLKSLDELVAQFRPFRVPPPPVPFVDEIGALQRRTNKKAKRTRQSRARPNSTLVVATETTPTEIQEPSAVPEIRDPTNSRQSYMERIRRRRQIYLSKQLSNPHTMRAMVRRTPHAIRPARVRGQLSKMQLISVKRQRKLKMKKHKYKKLMRRTRNLRRRLDRI